MSDLGVDPIFRGHTPGGMTCEDFVQAVRRHAVVEKKSRDKEYIADYAMSWFTDDALHWSETLSEEVRGDWSLLRPALLAEYGLTTRKYRSAVPSLPSAIIPVPAAAPPPPPPSSIAPIVNTSPLSLRGRMKVISPNFTGYLSKRVDDKDSRHLRWLCLAKENVSDACILFGTMENGRLRFKFENLDPIFSHLGIYLGMQWLRPRFSQNMSFAAMTVVDIQGPTTSSKLNYPWKGPVSWITWIYLSDGTLTLNLDDMPEAQIVTSGGYLYATSCVDAFVKKYRDWKQARVVFEPI